MPAINNLKGMGAKKTQGKICYSENLGNGLRLVVTQQFSSEGNPCLQLEAGVASEIHTSGNGIQYYYDAYEWCSNDSDYIAAERSATNSIYMPVIPQFKPKFKEEEMISKKGFVIKKAKELTTNTEGGEVWRETWRVSCEQSKLLSILKKE